MTFQTRRAISTVVTVVAIVLILVAGVGGYFVGATISPKGSTTTVTTTVQGNTGTGGTGAISTITKTVTVSNGSAPLSPSTVTMVAATPLTEEGGGWPALIASNLGIFAKMGLTVNVESASGSVASLATLVSGQAQFINLNPTVALQAKANGTDVRMIAMEITSFGPAIYTLKSSGITTPQQLEGKTIGTTFTSSVYTTFPAFAKVTGINTSSINFVNLASNTELPELLAGKVDAISAFAIYAGLYNQTAASQGLSLNIINEGNYVKAYGSGVATSDSFISQHPAVVSAFVQGYLYGLSYMLQYPQNASQIIASAVNGETATAALTTIETYNQIAACQPLAQGEPLGWMDDAGWNQTINIATTYLGVHAGVTPSQIYTDSYIPMP
jgi:NitT/TauT family transport system substrate-binding protein